MKRWLLMLLLLPCLYQSHAQDSLTVQDIDRIVAGIDADKKTTRDTYCDTLHLEVLTHYCEEALTDAGKSHLYRFTVKTSADKNSLTVYYFNNNEVIKVINEEWGKGSSRERRTLYYSHNHVIHDVAEGVHPPQEYFLQTAQEKVKELVGDTTQ